MRFKPWKSLCHKWALSCLFILLTINSKAQNSSTIQTLPDAAAVTLDTLFYTPDKPLPFDRFFTVKLSLPGTVTVNGYIVTPIDHNGKRKVTRRDYNLYTWSLSENRRELKKTRRMLTWQNFKQSSRDNAVILNDYVCYPAGKRTGIELKIPPLDPGREYKISIIITDQKVFEKFDLLTLPLANTFLGNSKINVKEFTKFMDQYEKIKPASQSFEVLDIGEYISKIKCGDVLNINTAFLDSFVKYNTDNFDNKITYRYIFSKDNINQSTASALLPASYLQLENRQVTEKASAAYIFASAIENGTKDVQKVPIDFSGVNGSATYKLYLLLHFMITDLKGDAVFDGDVSFQYLSDVTFVKDNEKDVLSWKPLTSQLSNCKEGILDDLVALKDNLLEFNTTKFTQFDNQSYLILQKEALGCPCADKGIKSIADVNDLTTLIGLMNCPPPDYIRNVLLGHSSLMNPYQLELKDLTVQLANVNTSLESIDILEDFARKTIAVLPTRDEAAVVESLVIHLRELRDTLLKNKGKLKQNIIYTSNFREFNLKRWQYKYLEKVTDGSTETIEFMTASKFKIVPDFGLVVIGNAPGKGLVHDVVPYLGFNINFRSIDKNIPMSAVHHKPWNYYFSFSAGLTLSSIGIDKKRDDLFAGRSLMGGFGFRLNNYLKIIGGGVFYKKYSLNPLSDEKSVAVSPYFGLSVDYELSDLFGGINKLFK